MDRDDGLQSRLQYPCLLQVPVSGDTQIVVAVAAVQLTVQKLWLPPLKQTFVSHSELSAHPTSATFFFTGDASAAAPASSGRNEATGVPELHPIATAPRTTKDAKTETETETETEIERTEEPATIGR